MTDLFWNTVVNGKIFRVVLTWNSRREGAASSHYDVTSDKEHFSFDIGDETEYAGRRFMDVYREEFAKALKKFGE